MRQLAHFLILVCIFLGVTVLVWPPATWMRIGIPALLGIEYCLRDRVQTSLFALSRSKAVVRTVVACTLLLGAVRGGIIGYRLVIAPKFMEDIAHVHVRAIRGLYLEHPAKNPYASSVDPYPITVKGHERVYSGFKYPPLQLLTYAPTVLAAGARGIYLFHLLVYLALCWLIFTHLRRFSLLHACLGLLFLFASDHVSVLCFNNGTNDPLPTLLLTVALLSMRRPKRAGRSGLALGAATLAKQLPGGLFFLPCLIQGFVREALAGLAVVLIGCLPFFLWGPRAFIDNVVVFNLLRPARDSSFLFGLSAAASTAIQIGGALAFLVLAALGRRWREWDMHESFTFPVFGLVLFLLTAKMTPFHYFLWVTPLYILWLLEPGPLTSASAPRPTRRREEVPDRL